MIIELLKIIEEAEKHLNELDQINNAIIKDEKDLLRMAINDLKFINDQLNKHFENPIPKDNKEEKTIN